MSEKDQPSWMPQAYVGVGVFGLAIVGTVMWLGSPGFLDAVIFGLSIGAIVVGVKQLRARRRN
jgi:hypothetical protein